MKTLLRLAGLAALLSFGACKIARSSVSGDDAGATSVAAQPSTTPAASATPVDSARPAATTLARPKPVHTTPKPAAAGKCKDNEMDMGDECARTCRADGDCKPGGSCTHFDGAAFRAAPDLCTWIDGAFTPPAPHKAASGVCGTSGTSDEVECEKEACADGWAPGSKTLGAARAGSCLRKCASPRDCKVKGNHCIRGVCDSGSE